MRSNLIVTALGSAVFPKLANSTAEEMERITRACYRSVCMLGPLYVAGILILPEFLAFWLGAGFAAKAARIGCILAISLWIEALSYVPYTLMQARSTLSREVRISMLIALPNALLLFGAVKLIGVEGAALVALLRSLLYFSGRTVATEFIGLPAFEVCTQSAFICAGAIIAMVPLNHVGRVIGACSIVAGSTMFAVKKRPEFIGELATNFMDFFRKPRAI
jgi:hypothetical protein